MLFEAATGGRMWSGFQPAEVVRTLVAGGHPRSPRERKPDVSEGLDAICRKALAPKPDQRYATAAEFREQLDEYIDTHERRPSNRQIGAFVAQEFGTNRARARTLVETQIAEMVSSKRSMISLAFDSGEPRETEAEVDVSVTFETSDAARGRAAEPTEATKLSPQLKPQPPPQQRSARLGVMWSVALISLALVLAGTAKLLRDRGIVGPGSARAGDSDTITLTLRATPLQTQFRIDDGPSIDNPYIARLPVDRKTHSVRASAPGFRDEVEEVAFDRDVSLRFALVHDAVQQQ
jgi:serine/threonine-protein kinase